MLFRLLSFGTCSNVFSRISGTLLDYGPGLNAWAYIRIGRPSWGMLLAAAVSTALYLACCLIQIERQPDKQN